MHVRIRVVRAGGREYRYVQLVESYRNARGVPTHRVLASFPNLSDQEAANFKAAVDASRDGKTVVVAEDVRQRLTGRPVIANWSYLEVAVALAMWRSWGLSELLAPLLGSGKEDASAADMVAALTVHRCIAPASKLAAVRWFATTALPELLGISPRQFNNSRVHRVLTQLDKAEEGLQEQLAVRLHERTGSFVALFLDITDTWFEGRGAPMAKVARTKEGLMKQKVGIALMCDRRGYPVRWKTLEGKYREAPVMEDMVREVKDLEWVGECPVVVDRAMGRAGSVEFLVNSGLRFVTAVPLDEYESYTKAIPHATFGEMKLTGTAAGEKKDLERLQRAAIAAGLEQVAPHRFVLDLGVVERPAVVVGARKHQLLASSRVRDAISLALRLEACLAQGLRPGQLAQANQCSPVSARDHRRLLRLKPALRERAMAGELDCAKLRDLHRVAALPEEEQSAAFDLLCQQMTGQTPKNPFKSKRNAAIDQLVPAIPVRCVLSFNPEQLLTQRRKADEDVREFEAFVDDLNSKLRSPNSRRKPESVMGDVRSELRRKKLTSVYEATVGSVMVDSRTCHRVELTFDDTAWQQRRRYDGFVLLVAEPTSPATAAETVDLYFAKDKVEKGFQTIKSELELRPLGHRTDPKTRAHVSLCAMALLLERTLEDRLLAAGARQSAPAAFEVLAQCHLNRIDEAWGYAYSLTRSTDEQRALLKALELEELDNDEAVRAGLTPR